MENKYYTPDIKEFVIGFCFETCWCRNGWEPICLETEKNVSQWEDIWICDAYEFEFRVKIKDGK